VALNPESGGPLFNDCYPHQAHAAWYASHMQHSQEDVLEAAASLYRPDLYIAAGGAVPPARREVFCDDK
jgi:hypothetical protein